MLESLAVTLFNIGAVRFGKFKLHSGKKSRIYLDLRVLASFPQALREVTAAYRTILDKLVFDLLAATPLAGLPIGTALCLDMDKPLIYPRKTAKNYGTGKEIEGVWLVGQTAVVVDDLVTSGDSILQTIVMLKMAGLQVKEAVVLIDREQGGLEAIAQSGYRLHPVLTITHLLTILQEKELITAREAQKALQSLLD